MMIFKRRQFAVPDDAAGVERFTYEWRGLLTTTVAKTVAKVRRLTFGDRMLILAAVVSFAFTMLTYPVLLH